MKPAKLKRLIPLLIIIILIVGGWYLDNNRSKERSVLSGYFESQPTQLASRIGGRTLKIFVKEGELVKAGQPLVSFEVNANTQEVLAKEAQSQQAAEQLKEVESGPRKEEIQIQQEVVKELQINLDKLIKGARPQEIAKAKAAERRAKAALAQAQRGLTKEEKAQFKSRLEQASAQLELAKSEYKRSEELYKQGAISKQQYDVSKTNLEAVQAKAQELDSAYKNALKGTPAEELEQAKEAYKEAKASYDLVIAGTRKEDISAAKAKLAQAKTKLTELKNGSRKEDFLQMKSAAKAAYSSARSAQINLQEKTIFAAQDGIIERILIATGDLVNPGTPVIRFSNLKDIWIKIYVPESELAKIAVGDKAKLKVDGINNSVEGYVDSIASQGEFTPANLQTPEERGKQVFAVRLRLKKFDGRIKAGMYASVTKIGNWKP